MSVDYELLNKEFPNYREKKLFVVSVGQLPLLSDTIIRLAESVQNRKFVITRMYAKFQTYTAFSVNNIVWFSLIGGNNCILKIDQPYTQFPPPTLAPGFILNAGGITAGNAIVIGDSLDIYPNQIISEGSVINAQFGFPIAPFQCNVQILIEYYIGG